MKMAYMNISTAAEKGGITARRVQEMCKNGTMFGGLKKYKNSGYRKNHELIHFQTADGLCKFRVTDVITTDIYDKNIMKYPSQESEILCFQPDIAATLMTG